MSYVASNRVLGTVNPLDVVVNDGSGNPVTSFGGVGGTSHGDDSAFTIGSASSVSPMGALADETSPDSVDEGDIGVVRMTADRKLLTRIVGATDSNRADVDASGQLQVNMPAASESGLLLGSIVNDLDDIFLNSVYLPVLAAQTADYDTGAGTDTTVMLGIALPASGGAVPGGTSTNPIVVNPGGETANVGVGAAADTASAVGGTGSLSAKLRLVTTQLDALSTSIATRINAAAAGIAKNEDATHASLDWGIMALGVRKAANGPLTDTDGDYEPFQMDANGNLKVSAQGDVAHDGADVGNPIKVGSKAVTALPTAVTANDRANVISDLHGRPYARLGAPATDSWSVFHEPAANAQATITKAAGTGTQRHVCTDLTATIAAQATAPAAVQVVARLRDGATGAGTVLWAAVLSIPATAGISCGVAIAFSHPKIGSQATAMTLEFSAAGGANTIEAVSLGGYTMNE